MSGLKMMIAKFCKYFELIGPKYMLFQSEEDVLEIVQHSLE